MWPGSQLSYLTVKEVCALRELEEKEEEEEEENGLIKNDWKDL